MAGTSPYDECGELAREIESIAKALGIQRDLKGA